MENQPTPTNASAWLSRKPATPDDHESEIARLRERLSFYESFDRLIQDNVSRAGELLRHAATMRENAEQEHAQARREVEELRLGDRQEFRSLLSGLLDEVTVMQVQIERLARRVSDALDDVEVTLPAGAEIDRLSAASSFSTGAVVVESMTVEALTLDPSPEELAPSEPELSEADYRAPVPEPADEVEAEAVAAEASEPGTSADDAPVATAEGTDSDSLSPDEQSEAQEDVAMSAEVDDLAQLDESAQPDTTLAVDEVVQAPAEDEAGSTESRESSSESDVVAADVVAGDDSANSDDTGSSEGLDASSDELELVAAGETTTEEAAPAAAAAEDPDIESADIPTQANGQPTEATPSRLPWMSGDVRPFSLEGIGGSVRRPGTGELRTPEPSPRSVSSPSPLLTGRGVATAVLVHGVPRATTALSLKRFLESLPHVASVEPREYAEGILRLHVTGQRSLQIDDLRGWSDGSGLEPVHLRDDLIEVRLPN